MAASGPNRRFFTTTEVAKYCEVSNDGVLKWIKSGKLRAFATPGGHYRISAEDFREFLVHYAFPIQESFFDSQSSKKTPRLLIVDDEADQREVLLRRLREAEPDWILDEAVDGYEAGIKIGSQQPDLVILDLMMPRIDGLSLCSSIRRNPGSKPVRVVAVTGSPDRELHSRAIQAGADACLTKPVPFERLHAEIVRLLKEPARRRQRPEQSI